MKKIFVILLAIVMCFSLIGASKPSLDGRAEVADYGELPTGLFAKSPGYLPGDTVIVTNPQANISIEVMIFGSFDATEGIAIVLSPEAAKELYISKGSNIIVQVTKKSDAYSENTILSKTLENYVPKPDLDSESEVLLDDPYFAELIKEAEEERAFLDNIENIEKEVIQEEKEDFVIPESEILFVEILEDSETPVEEAEVIAETPVEEEAEVIAETPVEEAEVIVETPVEEAEVIAETPVEEEAEVIAETPVEEEAEVIAETPVEEEAEVIVEIPVEEEAEVIVETPVEEEAEVIVETPVEEEYVAEMVRGNEEVKLEDVTEEEVALVPTAPKPPVYTIIPVAVDYEEDEDSDIIDEPTVIFVEDETEEDDETRNIIPVEQVIAIVPEEVVPTSINIVSSLKSSKYYVQIATYSKYENMEAVVKKYGKNYPIVVYQPSGRNDYQVMIGGLNKDEYAIVLERFRKAGYKDAFLRSTF